MAAGILTAAEAVAAVERMQRGQAFEEQALEWSGSLRLFVQNAWSGVPLYDDGKPLTAGWHIDAVCEHLEAVSSGEIRRLVICLPPGMTKSTVASVCFPAWEWTSRPSRGHLTCSYKRELAEKFAALSRMLILSSWFQQRWGKKFVLREDENARNRFSNNRGGSRMATPMSGATGQHADVIVIDDPHDAAEILSNKDREQVIEFHDGSLPHRYKDPEAGCEVIIAQRLHEKDLIGHVLEKSPDEWEVLCLPERYEARHPLVTPPKVRLPSGRVILGDAREQEGELLCPARRSARSSDALAKTLASFRAAGQLQQRPSAREGAILKRSHWQFFPRWWLDDGQRQHLPRFHRLVQSWDTAFKDRSVNDFVVGQLWGLSGPNMYLLAVRKERMSLSKTKQAIRDLSGWVDKEWQHTPHSILIENKTNGPDIILELQRELRGIIPFNSDASKVARAEAAEPALEGKNVWVPGMANPSLPSFYDPMGTPDFTQQLIDQAAAFPNAEHDDDVDAFTQAVIWSRGAGRKAHARLGRARGGSVEQGSLQAIR
jgi:predicted phage terminase large subunit-like protein